MNSLRFGTPGIPLSTSPYGTLCGVSRVRELGLDAMELEFTRTVNVNSDLAVKIKRSAEKNDVVLTCHGQYFVNLASLEKPKVDASINRMISAARRLHECGGWSATWHFAYYMGQSKSKVFSSVLKNIKEVVKILKDEGVNVWIRPETTGKQTQWGDLAEVIKLSQSVEQVLPCVDFAHLHARSGRDNSLDEFRKIFSDIEEGLGRTALDNMHIQVSGIKYGLKGEQHHLNLLESDMNWKDLLKVFKEFKIKGVVITESPNIESDALLLKKHYLVRS